MSDRGSRSIIRASKHCFILLAAVAGSVFLPSCGGEDSNTSSNGTILGEAGSTAKAQAAVPGTWTGRVPTPTLAGTPNASFRAYKKRDLLIKGEVSGDYIVRGEISIYLKSPNSFQDAVAWANGRKYKIVGVGEVLAPTITLQTSTLNESGLDQIITEVEALPYVEFASKSVLGEGKASEIFNDAAWTDIDIKKVWNLRSIKLEGAFKEIAAKGITLSAAVAAGVVDTGFYFEHEDFPVNHTGLGGIATPRDLFGLPTDESSHGSHVVGILGATHNTIGITGVGGNSLRVVLSDKLDDDTDLEASVRSMISRSVRAVNLSLGLPACKKTATPAIDRECIDIPNPHVLNPDDAVSHRELRKQLLRYSKLIEYAKRTGAPAPLFVQSSGNEGLDRFGQKFRGDPAATLNPIISTEYQNYLGKAVGSILPKTSEEADALKQLASHTIFVASYSEKNGVRSIDDYSSVPIPRSSVNSSIQDGLILAPGTEVYSIWHKLLTKYNFLSGTSMAAPHVTGLATLISRINPALTAPEIREIILSTAERQDGGQWKSPSDGYRFLNAESAVKEAIVRKNCGTISAPFIAAQGQGASIYQVTAGEAAIFTATAMPKPGYPFTRFDWKTSEGVTASSLFAPEASIKFSKPTTPPAALAKITVTPVLADGTECTDQAQSSSVNVIPAPSPVVGLIGKYSFDDCTASDSSGLGRDGLKTGTACVPGHRGNALQFRNPSNNVFGGVDWVTLPPHTSNSVSFSAWVNWSGSANGPVTQTSAIWSLGTHTSDSFMSIWVTEGLGTLWTDYYTPNPYRLTPGTWTMLTITSNGTSESLYMNGVLLSTYQNRAIGGFAGRTAYLSRHFWAGGQNAARYRGLMDDVFIYERVLTPDEVFALYLSTK